MGIYHYIKEYILSFVFMLLLSSQIKAFPGKYPIQNFTPIQYKAGIQNIDFAQNRDMTLFVANNLGVLSYNGNDWDLHYSNSGKKIRSLAFDEKTNRLYVGSQGEMGYMQDDWNYISLIDEIPLSARDFDEVWDVFLLNSNIYFCTFQSIYVYDGQSFSVIDYQNKFDRSFKVNGKLYTQSQHGKLLEVNEDIVIPFNNQNKFNQIIASVILQDDGILVFYNSGEIEFATTYGVRDNYDALTEILKGKYVNHVLQLSDSRLAISTQTSGLFLYDLQNDEIDNISAEDGLLSNACLRTFQDYSGNLWVGMQNGIALIDINSPMRFINQDIDIQGSGYEAFEIDEGTYYTTSNGIYFLEKDASSSVFLEGTEGPAYGMQEIAGQLYAGHHTGLFLLEEDKAMQLAQTDGLWQVKQLKSKPEYVIGGTYSGLYLFRLNENRILQAVQKITGFNESSRFFEEDGKERIWVGQFYKGLYQLNLSKDLSKVTVKKITNDDLPIQDQIILTSINNEIYIATNEGLYRLDQSTDQIVEDEMFSKDIGKQPVYLVIQDNQKNVHVLAENTVGYFNQISAQHFVHTPSSLFQLQYSLNNDLLNGSVNTQDGILFSANEGFISYNTDLEDFSIVDIPLVINSVFSVTEDSILYGRKPFEDYPESIDKIVVTPKGRVLQFHIESFQYKNLNNQLFRYFLKGFDQDFGEWTNATTKEYTNLREGEYEFIVQTKNYIGEIKTSNPFLFEVKPPLFRSIGAKIFYLLLGIFSLFLVSRDQRRRYRAKAKEIEEARKRELREKQQKLIEIEEQKKQELLQLKEEKMQSELWHLNNQLAATTMNLVVKNEFIENIREELKEVKRKGDNPKMNYALDQIVREIDTTLRIQEDWKQFELHFDQVHRDFFIRLREEFPNLSPNDQKLCAFLKLNLNTKDIANIMSISLRGVEMARYRLRKKLNLKSGQNLSKYILEY